MKLPYIEEAAAELERRLPPGSLRARFAKGTTWSLIGTVISQGLALLASIVVARVLGKVGYGELGMVRSTVGMFGTFAGLGLGLTATKYIAEFRESDPDRAGRITGLSFVVSVFTGGACALAVFYFAPVLATRAINAPHLVPELRIATLLLLLNALIGVQTGVLVGFEAFKTIAYTILFRGLASFPLVVAGVLLAGLPGAIWSFVLTGGVALAVNQVFLKRECEQHGVYFSYRGIFSERRMLWDFSFPAFLSAALVGPVSWGVNAMLVYQPGGYAELGIFSAANSWQRLFTFIPGLVGQVTVPMLSSLQGSGNPADSKKVLRAAILTAVLVAVPVLSALLVFGGSIMSFYGPGFSSRGAVLQLTALTGVLIAAAMPVGDLIAASGRMWVGAAMNGARATVLLFAAWIFTARGWGADGVAGAYLVANLCHAGWVAWFGSRILRERRPAKLPFIGQGAFDT